MTKLALAKINFIPGWYLIFLQIPLLINKVIFRISRNYQKAKDGRKIQLVIASSRK